MVWLDEYDRRARLVPGLWAVAPVAVLVVALGLRHNAVIALVVGLLSTAGGPVVLAGYVRRRGLAEQERLWEAWDGPPTTAMMRHRGPASEQAERARLRSQVAGLLGISFPTENDEQADPAAADAAYAGAVRQLIGRTRDKAKFGLVFAENKNYGYERNMIGMQVPGTIISGTTAGALLLVAALSATAVISRPILDLVVGAAVAGADLAVWRLVPSRANARRVAEAYASRLAEASWTLTTAK